MKEFPNGGNLPAITSMAQDIKFSFFYHSGIGSVSMDPTKSRPVRLLARLVSLLSLTEGTGEDVPSSCFRYSHPVWTCLPLTERPGLYGRPCTFKLFSIFSSSLNRIPADWEVRGCMESHVYLQAVLDILIQFEPDSRWLGGQGLDMTASASHQAVQQLTYIQN
jgi:hypothetical protein